MATSLLVIGLAAAAVGPGGALARHGPDGGDDGLDDDHDERGGGDERGDGGGGRGGRRLDGDAESVLGRIEERLDVGADVREVAGLVDELTRVLTHHDPALRDVLDDPRLVLDVDAPAPPARPDGAGGR